jgi:hypothetical protein
MVVDLLGAQQPIVNLQHGEAVDLARDKSADNKLMRQGQPVDRFEAQMNTPKISALIMHDVLQRSHAEMYRREYGSAWINAPGMGAPDPTWRCVCGQINSVSEESCSRCGMEQD